MATNIEDKVIEKLRGLPESRQAEVLRYVEELVVEEAGHENGHTQPAIWDKIETIMGDVPDEVLETIPTDGSVNVDHYLYGAPKKR